METYDVLVVGAGPGGAAAARRCVDHGLKTLLIDKKKLPRRKACSGIIANISQNYVLENFGPIPAECFGRPYASRGMCFYFPSVGPVFADADCYAPYVWRDKFDHFLARSSGAELRDETRFDCLKEEKDHLIVTLRSGKETVEVKTAYLVGADGGRSRVIDSFAPDVYDKVAFAWARQKYYEGEIDADDRYLYWFLIKGMGPFPWLNIKDGQIIIGLAHVPGVRFNAINDRYLDFLKKNLGLKIKGEIASEGCLANMMSPLNRFFPGRRRVLMAGDACGLMHQGGEGISCALMSGGYAGDAIYKALNSPGTEAVPLYRQLLAREMEIALDQFNPFRITRTAASTAVRQPPIFRNYSLPQKARMSLEMIDFVLKEFRAVKGVLPQILINTLRRSILRKYRIRTVD